MRAARPLDSANLPWLAGLVAGVLSYVFGYQSRSWVTDTDSALQPAWQLIHHGTFRVPTLQYVPEEFFTTSSGMYSNRPLGMILVSLPGQLFSPHGPSELGSAVIAAVLCAVIAYLCVDMFGRLGLVAVFGAPLLYVDGRTLWPQTVGLLGMLVAMRLARTAPTSLRASAGVAAVVAAVTMCRPPLGLLLVPVVAVWADSDDVRTWWRSRTLVAGAVGVAAGMAVMLAYSRWEFSMWSLTPGYPVSHGLHWSQLGVGLFSPARGLLFWSPFVLAARPDRKGTVVLSWAAAYTVCTWLLYNAWGGDGFTGYRYAVTLAFLAVPYVRTDTLWRRVLVSWSVGLGLTATVLSSRPIARTRDWTHTGMPALVFSYAVLLSLTIALGWEYLRRRPTRSAHGAPATLSPALAVA